MARYVLTERITTDKGACPWRLRPAPLFERVSIYESFEEAKKDMRVAISLSTLQYGEAGFFPRTEDGGYTPLKDYMNEFKEPERDLLRLDGILRSLFNCEPSGYNESELDICDEEYDVQPTAFILNKRLLNVTLDREKIYSLETNAHNIKDPDKTYYFIARVKDEYVWKTVFTIEITLNKAYMPYKGENS